MTDEVTIEYMKLGDLVPWPRNPKQHDVGALHGSVNRFGYVDPIIIDERTKRITSGHGRLETLLQKKEAGENPPARVKVDPAGEWLVPVIRGISFNSDAEAEAYLIAANRLVTLGGFNDAQLIEVLRDLADTGQGLAGTGFDGDDLDSLIAQLEGVTPKEEFKGGYAETEEEFQARTRTEDTSRQAQGLREVILLMKQDQHDSFTESVKVLRSAWAAETAAEVVVEALKRSVSRELTQ